MKLFLKILSLPVVIVLTPLCWICFGILRCSAWIFGLAATILTALGVFAWLTVSAKDGLAFIVLALLVSPVGLPLLAVHIVGGIYSVNDSLKQFIRN